LALEAYWRAFDADEPVLLIIKTCAKDITRWHRHWRNAFRLQHPSPLQTIEKMARRHGRLAPVVVIADESLSDGEIQALHEIGDCFISLTRTEGWGLGAFEAARLGCPVVMTGYGGQLDFLDPKRSWLVDYEMVPVHEPTWAANYRAHDRWAEPSVDQAAAHMRSIFEKPEHANAKAANLARDLERTFSQEAVISTFIKALTAGAVN
jgi:glycosyltransferase involved in cell wall biosynthesis